mmetsp:Transcript_101153/g.123860  ORF Transcript_101153/g.123860 Transcript_101153/m.123860 type:complete len:425 (-) Transcript_101153:179-1453(-)
MGNTFLGRIVEPPSRVDTAIPIGDVPFGFHFFGALIVSVISAYMMIEMCMNEKYKHLAFKFESKIIKMQNQYFVWTFWSLFYILIYGISTVFFFSNAIFRWKYDKMWRPALLFLHGIHIGAFTAGNSFGIAAYIHRMEAFLIPEVNKWYLICHRIILYFIVVFMICMTFYGDYNYFSTTLIDGSLVLFMHFPPFYQGIWLTVSIIWIISIIFLCWEFNSMLRKYGFMEDKSQRAKTYRMGREGLMVLLFSLTISIMWIISLFNIEKACWYWNVELIILSFTLYYGFEFNDKSFFRICRPIIICYFKALCIYENGDDRAMYARQHETQCDYDMEKITPSSTKYSKVSPDTDIDSKDDIDRQPMKQIPVASYDDDDAKLDSIDIKTPNGNTAGADTQRHIELQALNANNGAITDYDDDGEEQKYGD